MRLWVPEIGDAFKLDADWTFTLHGEYRNYDLFEAENVRLGAAAWRGHSGVKPVTVTLPAGTELVVDRVYIRQGAADFSSFTFLVKGHPTSAEHFGCRFWAKLADINLIDATPTSSGNPVGPIAKGHYRNLALPDKEQEKKVAAKEKREASKRALNAARMAIIEVLRPSSTASGLDPVLGAHLKKMVDSVIDARTIHAKANGYQIGGYYTDFNSVKAQLLTAYKGAPQWHVVSTKVDSESGLTTRHFNLTVHGVYSNRVAEYVGFTVVSEGEEVREIRVRE